MNITTRDNESEKEKAKTRTRHSSKLMLPLLSVSRRDIRPFNSSSVTWMPAALTKSFNSCCCMVLSPLVSIYTSRSREQLAPNITNQVRTHLPKNLLKFLLFLMHKSFKLRKRDPSIFCLVAFFNQFPRIHNS